MFDGEGFWSSKKVIFISILILGIILGILAGHYVVEPIINNKIAENYESCTVKVDLMETQLDSCYKCIDDKGFEVQSCN
ncbi:MAG: hypothetical protein V1672_05755 [Candidatus Diapherotrites archaeon]